MNIRKRFVCGAVLLITIYVIFKLIPQKRPPAVFWHRNASRNTKDYINENLKPPILPTNFCTKASLLVVFVISKPDKWEARAAIRDTWARKQKNVSFYFLLGEIDGGQKLKHKLETESLRHNDIIQDRFIESYYNLTLKSVNMLKLYKKHCSKTSKYLMKIDDDVFFNVQNLVHTLLKWRTTSNLLLGQIYNGTSPIRDPYSKWFVPYEWYPEEKYPDYVCGASYVMSGDVANKLYSCALRTPLFYIEDVYLTGICARKTHVKPQHDSLFSCRSIDKYICDLKNYYALHDYGPRKMRHAYDHLVGGKCEEKSAFLVGWYHFSFVVRAFFAMDS